MYLKSITLKGFKSFPKKTTLTLGSGITCVVGPNGSGKSNLSDALLWVLGERSAKNIRGEDMSDVIFSGSANAKKSSLAEVSIVLDNSDSLINIDYSDVVITRRAYRSGETEYFLNDTRVRRADVIRVLSDSGLGQGTHSIISQGSLDSVLSLDEYQLREVIEETAGVLRYKQMKNKTLKKIERLEVNVKRINDIIFEVDRQLEPLQRKAKRARTYLEIKDELKDARLKLGLDDHRRLSASLGSNREKMQELKQKEERLAELIESCEDKVNVLTEKIHQLSLKSEEKNKIATSLAKGLDNLENIYNTLLTRIDDGNAREDFYTSQSFDLEKKIAILVPDIEDVESKLAEVREELDKIGNEEREKRDELGKLKREIEDKTSELGDLEEVIKKTSDRAEKTKGEVEEIKSSLSGRASHLAFLSEKKSDLERRASDCKEKLEEKEGYYQDLRSALELSKKNDSSSRAALSKCAEAKEAAEAALRDAREKEHSLLAQIDGLKNLIQKQDRDVALQKFCASSKEMEAFESLWQKISVDAQFEDAVEAILGERLRALLASDPSSIKGIIGAINDSEEQVSVSILTTQAPLEAVNTCEKSLSRYVKCDESIRELVESLLGDIEVVDRLNLCALNKRALTRDGHYVDGRGGVVLNLSKSKLATGALTRKRQVDEMTSALEAARANTKNMSSKVEDALSSLQEAQSASLLATEEVAKVTMQLEACEATLRERRGEIDTLSKSLEDVNKKISEESTFVDSAEPEIAKKSELLANLNDEISAGKKVRDAIVSQLQELKETLAASSAHCAKLTSELEIRREKSAYRDALLRGKRHELSEARSLLANYGERIESIKQAIAEMNDFSSKFQKVCTAGLRFQEGAIEESDKEVATKAYEELSLLRQKVSSLRVDKDACRKVITDLEVEKTKLEIELESVIKQIEDNSDRPILEALTTDAIEDRGELEDIEAALSKKIQRLGNIDFEAEREYELLNERSEFLKRHARDIELALNAVSKIDSLIEKRFDDQFKSTFAAVDANFREIFATLFPGGMSEIQLVESDGGSREEGVLIKANPAGKKISRMSLLSGGERSLTALSFLFALYNTRQTPFYVLDEVEAALDDTNLSRLLAYIDNLRQMTQFIMITHQRRTMEMADLLFGVSMQADGITRVISQRLSDFNDQELDAS